MGLHTVNHRTSFCFLFFFFCTKILSRAKWTVGEHRALVLSVFTVARSKVFCFRRTRTDPPDCEKSQKWRIHAHEHVRESRQGTLSRSGKSFSTAFNQSKIISHMKNWVVALNEKWKLIASHDVGRLIAPELDLERCSLTAWINHQGIADNLRRERATRPRGHWTRFRINRKIRIGRETLSRNARCNCAHTTSTWHANATKQKDARIIHCRWWNQID